MSAVVSLADRVFMLFQTSFVHASTKSGPSMSTLSLGSCRLAAAAKRPYKLASTRTRVLCPVRGVNRCRVPASTASRSRGRDLPTRCAALAVADQLVAAGCPSSDVAALQRADDAWRALCEKGPPAARQVVFQHSGTAQQVPTADAYDVVVLGGTLGILLATALLATNSSTSSSSGGRPWRVAVVERGQLLGREQEWNITRSELQVFQDLGVLTAEEVAAAVTTTYPGVRMGVARGPAFTVGGVMDCGVSPRRLLEAVTRRFKALGGTLLEHTAFTQVDVYDNTALLTLQRTPRTNPTPAAGGAGGTGAAFAPVSGAQAHQEGQAQLSAQLVLDALGGFSPISMQMRQGQRPESAMLLVGSCARAAPGDAAGDAADVLWARNGLDSTTGMQYWWEKFPAAGGAATTTYMFAFTDPAPTHTGLLSTMAAQYLQQLPGYLAAPSSSATGSAAAGAAAGGGQGSLPPLDRLLVGFVPCYNGRVPPAADRVLPVGDSAGNRSSLSLAGFCALVRHLPRLVTGITEALAAGALTARELALLQPYCPGVATTSAMQRTMAVHSNQTPAILASLNPSAASGAGAAAAAVKGDVVLDMVGGSFQAMWEAVRGEEGLRPFLADCITWAHMSATIGRQLQVDAAKVLSYHLFLGDTRSGPRLLSGLVGLAAYTALHATSAITGPFHEALLAHQPRLLFRWRRTVEGWRYGSGADWTPSTAAAAAAAAEGRQLEQQRPATPAGGGSGGMTAGAESQQQQGGGLSQSAVPLATAGPPRGPIVAFGSVDPDSLAEAAAAAEGAEEEEEVVGGLRAVVDADWLWDVTHSVDTHEDGMAEGWKALGATPGDAAAAAAAALQSADTYEDALLMEGLRSDTTSSSSGSKRHEAAVAGAVERYTALGAGAAAAQGAPQPRGGPAEWSVDTHEDSLLEDSSSSAAAGAGAGAPQGDWYATHSQDNNEDSLMDGWGAAPAAAAGGGGDGAGDPSKWSLDTYEDSMLKGVAAAAVSEAEWDATHSQDNSEEDLLGPAGSSSTTVTVAAAHPRGVSGDAVVIGGMSVEPVYRSQDTYEEDLLAAAGVDVVVTPPAAPGADGSTAAAPNSSTSSSGSRSGAVGGSAAGLGPRGGPVVGFLVVKEAESAEQTDEGEQETQADLDICDMPVGGVGGAMATANTPAGSGSSSSSSKGSQEPSKRSAGGSTSTSPRTPQQGSDSSSNGRQRGGVEGGSAPKPGSWRGTWRPQPEGRKGSRRLSDLEQGTDEGV